jgi:hypothetical protein
MASMPVSVSLMGETLASASLLPMHSRWDCLVGCGDGAAQKMTVVGDLVHEASRS